MTVTPGPPDGHIRRFGLVGLFINHPNAANLLMILMIMFGVFSMARINTQFFPTLSVDAVTISVSWSGASAEDVASNVLQVIEPEVRFVDGVDKIDSYAREGAGSITLQFEPGTDMQKATSDVDSAVKAINTLPEDADTPKVSQNSFFDRVARIAISGDVPEQTLRIYARKIRDDLIARGIDKVSFSGLRSEELQVTIPEDELYRLGLSVDDISRKIASNSRDLPAGQTDGSVEKQVRTLADVKTPQNLGKLEVHSFASGEKVRLRDIATIRQGFDKDEARGFSRGKRAIQITVERSPTADTLETAAILDNYLADIENDLPPGITLEKYEVRADALTNRIWLLISNGITGLFLVVATLFIFLNARIAFWVAAGIPVAMLTTLGLLFVFGQSVNMISLFAMIMMLGVIVDDAIVVGEHTATHFARGEGAFEAAANGAGRMIVPVVAAVTTTIASFSPILLVGDVIGQIMGVLPIVVIATAIASLIECFLVLPGHLAHALQPKKRRNFSFKRLFLFGLGIGVVLLALVSRGWVGGAVPGPLGALVQLNATVSPAIFIAVLAMISLVAGFIIEGLVCVVNARLALRRARKNPQKAAETGDRIDLEAEEGWFRQTFDRKFNAFRDGPIAAMVRLAFHWRYVTVAIALSSVLVVVVGLLGGGLVKFVFFPSPESENLRARLVFNAGVPEESAISALKSVEESLFKTEQELTGGKEKLVTAVFETLGKAGRSAGDNLAEIRVQLTTSEQRTVRTPVIVDTWRKNLPKIAGLRRVAVYATRGGPPGRDIEIELTGGNDDMFALKRAATEVIDVVKSLNGVSGVDDDLAYGKPELVMRLQPRGAALGFSLEEVGRQVRNAFDGAIPRKFARGDDEVKIVVTMTSERKGSDFLRNFLLKSPSGEFVPLTEVVSLNERQGFSAIQRKDGKAIVSITGDLDTDIITTEEAIAELNAGQLPIIVSKHGLNYRFGGRAEERKEAFADLKIGVIVALFVIYMILAWVFSSYFRPFAIMLIIPFGIVGAVFGHWIMGYALTMLSMISLLGLVGILVNDSIILVSRIDERLEAGQPLDEAAVGASCDRLRAVLLTSLTTIGGLIPLMFEKDIQAQFLLPMAITIIFGLALTTLLVLFLVPAFVGIGDDIRRVLAWVYDHSGGNWRNRGHKEAAE